MFKVDFVLSAVVIRPRAVFDVLVVVSFDERGIRECVCLGGLFIVFVEVEKLFVGCFDGDSDVL
jgi:hypothetical protein